MEPRYLMEPHFRMAYLEAMARQMAFCLESWWATAISVLSFHRRVPHRPILPSFTHHILSIIMAAQWEGGSSPMLTMTRSFMVVPITMSGAGLIGCCGAALRLPSAGSPAEHVGRYIQTIRQNIGTDLNGKPLPQPQLWAACLEYRDTTGQPSSWAGASLTVEMDWIGNGPDDGNSRQIQSLVVAQNNPSGTPVEISSVLEYISEVDPRDMRIEYSTSVSLSR